MITAETKKYQVRRPHDASYGTMISVDSLYRGQMDNYSKMFIEIPFPIQKAGLHIQPSGKYIQAFYRFSYEVIINENVIERLEDAIVQVEIPMTIPSSFTREE